MAWTDDQNDPQYAMSGRFRTLRARNRCKRTEVLSNKLPIPAIRQVVTEEDLPGYSYEEGKKERYAGERLAAYVNFYIANKAILVPQFQDKNDQVP